MTGEAEFQGTVLEATQQAPCLSLCLQIPPELVAKTLLALATPETTTIAEPVPAFIGALDVPITECVVRILRSLSDPAERAIVLPLALEELVFRLLRTDAASAIRAAVHPDRDADKIHRAMQFLRANLEHAVAVEDVARHVAMSPSHFAHRFLAVARVSPMRYLKGVRLAHARTLLLNDNVRVSEVLVRVHYSGMCGTDVHVHHGAFPLPTPVVAGHEPTGDIVELGAGITDLKVGDRVGVFWNQKGCGRCAACQAGQICPTAQTWMHVGGGNSEFMIAWASGCALIPDGLSLELAAPLFCAGYTVMSGLRNATPKAGERVTVLGAGGLGHLAIQIARALGFETIALTGQADKRAELIALGADEVLVSDGDPGKVLRDAGGTDVILSTTNSAKQISSAFGGLRPRGRLISMGVADGPVQIDTLFALMNQVELRGSTQDERSDLAELLNLAAKGKVKPKIEVYPLAKANEAFARLESGKVRYRAVLEHAAG